MYKVACVCLPAVLLGTPATATPQTLTCTAWGGSHTSRYTFDVDAQACSVYWREIDHKLQVSSCAPPHIEVIKPFAPASGYVLRFNLETGGFSDHVPGWAERGKCTPAKQVQ